MPQNHVNKEKNNANPPLFPLVQTDKLPAAWR